MNIYETILIFSATLPENKRKEAIHELVAILNENKALELEEHDWGRRDLSFTMDKVKTAHFVQLVYKLDKEDVTVCMEKLTANLRIMDTVAKFQTHKIFTTHRKPKRNTSKAYDM